MTRRLTIVAAAAATALAAAAVAAAAPAPSQPSLQLTPILRVPFPDRGYLVDLPKAASLGTREVHVFENGRGIGDFTFGPLSATNLRFGAVLAIDSSLTMAGKPYAGALAAARSFISHRGENEQIGLLTFNTDIRTLSEMTSSAGRLDRAVANAPAVAYGTHIFDSVDASLALLRRAKVSTGAIVLLTDGQNVGSKATLSGAITRASRQHVRVFTVGLRSPAFDPKTLARLAAGTGGSYAEATSPSQLAPIYAALSTHLAREYVLQYRSLAAPKSHVDVQVSIAGFGASTASYTAPTPSELAPFHRSLFTRFLESTGSLLVLALLVAGLMVYVTQKLVSDARSRLVERVSAFAAPGIPVRPGAELIARSRTVAAAGSKKARGLLAGLSSQLEIADIRMSAASVVGLTIVATVVVVILIALISPIVSLVGLLTPVVSRELVRFKLKRVRDDFAEQLAPNLQVLASALRAGHSFGGALATVVEQAAEPSRRELRRAVSDEQLGVPMDEALRRVAERMQNRDLEQVALVAELARTTGGNVAEVLDVVVGTIRERQDVRRLIRTLTAQGRLARWILTALPIFTGFFVYAIQPDIVGPFYSHTIGQVALVFTAVAVASGSLVIQRIIEIEV